MLISSRLAAARDDIEFRERTVESYLGWSLWILGTPILLRSIGRLWDKFRPIETLAKGKSSPFTLMKNYRNVWTNKERSELLLLPDGEKKSKLLQRYSVMRLGALALNVILMGIIEPIIAIKWSAHQAMQKPVETQYGAPKTIRQRLTLPTGYQ